MAPSLSGRVAPVAAFTVPVVVVAMVPAWQFDHWQWLSLCLAAPVVVGAAAPVHRGAWRSLRRGSVSVDGLVAVAVLAGFGWSVLALFMGGAAAVGTPPPAPLLSRPAAGSDGRLYLAVVSVLAGVALAGRWVERRRDGSGPGGHRRRFGSFAAVIGGPGGTTDRSPVDRVAGPWVVLCTVGAAATAGFWLAASGDAVDAAGSAVAVLVVACPAGFSLAAPLVLAMADRRGGDVGVRVDMAALGLTRHVTTVVVPVTGVITTGEPRLVDVVTTEATTVDRALSLVASLARRSQHPLGPPVVQEAQERCVPLWPVEVLADVPGVGMRGVVDGHTVVAGHDRLVAEFAPRMPAELAWAREEAAAAGHLALLAGWDEQVQAVVVLDDGVRPHAAEAIRALDALGIEPVLADGDGGAPMGSASLVVPAGVHADLWTAVDGIRLGRGARRLVLQNVVLASGGNVALFPLAAAGQLNPLLAVAAAGLSVLAVLVNSARILRFRSVRPPAHRCHPAPA